MGSRRDTGRPEGEHVYRLIAHAASLNREAARAFDSGKPEQAMALLEQAEMLSEDVTGWVDDIESAEIHPCEPAAESKRDKSAMARLKHLGAGLSAGLTFGCVVSEI